jgi:hypothetical protein
MMRVLAYALFAGLFGVAAAFATSFTPEGYVKRVGEPIASAGGVWRESRYCYTRVYGAFERAAENVSIPAYRVSLSQFDGQIKIRMTFVLKNGSTVNAAGICRIDENPKSGNYFCDLSDCESCNVVVQEATENLVTISADTIKLWDSEKTTSFALSGSSQQRLHLEAYRTLEPACWE